MKKITYTMMVILWVFCGQEMALAVGDDFNDNAVDTNQWAEVGVEGGAVLTETNQRLEFTSTNTTDGYIEWVWAGAELSYTQDWSVAIDSALLLEPGILSGQSLFLGLAIHGGDFVFDLDFDIDEFGFSLGNYVSDLDDIEYLGALLPVVTNQLSLQIAFDASTKVLSSFYRTGGAYVAFTNYSAASWSMTDADVFALGILGESIGLQVASGAAYLDNFKMVPYIDADTDTLPDTWEVGFFGSTNAANGGASDDWDNDSQMNIEEYIAGTDPTNSASVFAVSPLVSVPTGFVVNWPSVVGRRYSVQWTDSLTNGFQNLATNMVFPQGSFTDAVHAAESAGFYLLQVELQD